MNVYAIAPLIAVIAYIPLLITTAFSRPWQKRYTLFVLFIIAAIIWSTIDIFLRIDFFPNNEYIPFKLIVISYSFMVVQLHLFTSSFFPKGVGRWLPFSYGSFIFIALIVGLGYISGDVTGSNGIIDVGYTWQIIFVFVPLIILAARNYYVFIKMSKHLNNPVLYNQVITLLIAIGVITTSTIASLFPAGDAFPIPHYGSLINAFILSYAVIRHQLVDIKIVIMRSTA